MSGFPTIPAGQLGPWDDPDLDGIPNSRQEPWQRHPFRFNANIRISCDGFAIVANCRVNDLSYQSEYGWGFGSLVPNYLDDSFEQDGYLTRGRQGTSDANTYLPVTGAGRATFRMADQLGISVNGLFHFNKPIPGAVYGTPETTPWMFRPGIAVRDSFSYAHLQSKIEAGGADLMTVNNVLRDAERKADWKGSGGTRVSTGSSFLSRGSLMGGSNVKTYENDMITTEHQLTNPRTLQRIGIFTNDGEGFMIDTTTTVIRGWDVKRNRLNANVFAFKGRSVIDMTVIDNDWYTNIPQTSRDVPIWVEADPNGDPNYFLQNVVIEDNTNLTGTVKMLASQPGSGNTFKRNSTDGPQRTLEYTATSNVDIEDNVNFNLDER